MTDQNPESEPTGQRSALDWAIEAAMQQAVREAVIRHKRMGWPMVIWRDEQVVWVPAEELVIDESDPINPVLEPPPIDDASR